MADGQPLRKPPGFRDQQQIPPIKPPPAAVAPPPPRSNKPAMPPSFYHTRKKRRSCCRFCCCFMCCVLLLIIVLLALFGGLFYVWFQPKFPIFRFKPVELDRFNVTAKPDGTALLDSKAIIRVEIKNPNGKLPIYYGETGVTLTADEDTQMGTGKVPAFRQPTNNVTLLKVSAAVDNQVVDKMTASALAGRVKSEQVVVNAAIKTKVGIGVWGWKVGMLPVRVDCGGVTLKHLNDGNGSPKCTFNTLRWITIRS